MVLIIESFVGILNQYFLNIIAILFANQLTFVVFTIFISYFSKNTSDILKIIFANF